MQMKWAALVDQIEMNARNHATGKITTQEYSDNWKKIMKELAMEIESNPYRRIGGADLPDGAITEVTS